MARESWAVAIHGGAGRIERGSTDRLEADCRRSLLDILQQAAHDLRAGGSALDAVETAVRRLEDDPLFNAGRGAVFSADGRNELDASIMDGATLKAGAVANVTRTRHPITLARTLMERSRHVMLAGPAADQYAQLQGLEMVDPSFFFTERRWKELEKFLADRAKPVPARPSEVGGATVGAVALDAEGNVAAATSTGGMTGKHPGRVGDSAIIGAGTFARNGTCAVSGTGAGEFFIRLGIAREIGALVEYKNYSVQHAADELVHQRLSALAGSGGVIVVSANGDLAWSFNTEEMYRAKAAWNAAPQVCIFSDEP